MGFFRRPTPADPAEVQRLKDEIAALRDALDRHGEATQAVHDRLSTLDDRVTSVSTELANQLNELGGDIDALANMPPAAAVDPALLTAVEEGQVRLANEQARYQIAFREDLARLAQELKRPR
jgi:uncharacterized protein YhaN